MLSSEFAEADTKFRWGFLRRLGAGGADSYPQGQVAANLLKIAG